jgi:protocatechuate 3,4-dioxygenase beta subunit
MPRTPGRSESDRRRFLQAALCAGAAVTVAPWRLLAQCDEWTTPDILGPFYLPGAPERTVLASADEPGQRLFVSGRVLGRSCVPLVATVVDVWHASDAGCYSAVQPCPDEDPLNLRGQSLTGADGSYAFETVLPGRYLNGPTYRPRHIHFRLAPVEGDVLVTQLYFEGDPYIETDPHASDPAAAGRIVPLVEADGALTATFDIALEAGAAVAVGDEALPDVTVLHANHPNPFNPSTTIRYQLHAGGPVTLEIHDARGRRVRTLVRAVQEAGYHSVLFDGRDERGARLASGVYLSCLEAAGRRSVRPLVLAK